MPKHQPEPSGSENTAHAVEAPQRNSDAAQLREIAPFDLSSFKVDSSTLEIRYPFALTLWDKSGLLWQSIQEKWPDITPVHAEPKKTSFRLGNTALDVEFEAARITTNEPDRSLDDFAQMARDFVTAAIGHLKIPC